MREYETTFIVQPEISSEGIEAICSRLDGVLEKQGAIRLLYDDMGRRRLAYEIGKFQKGHYLTLMYLDEGTVVPEVERALRIDDSVLRYLTVLVSERVQDIEARKGEAAALEEERARKAAERAARDAEDAAREAEEAARAAEESARAAEVAAESDAEESEEPDSEADSEAEAETEAAPEAEAEAATEDEADADSKEKEG